MQDNLEQTHRFRKLGRANPDALWDSLSCVKRTERGDETVTRTADPERVQGTAETSASPYRAR